VRATKLLPGTTNVVECSEIADSRLSIRLSAIFLVFFLVTLVVACSATAVPASAATSATTATMSAGLGRDRINRLMPLPSVSEPRS
jgi:hypothetical protein